MAVEYVYVHAPFCARRCSYCDFAVTVDPDGDVGAWERALTAELAAVEEEGYLAPADVLRTLYVGGGTPSLLGPRAMDVLGRVLGPDRVADPGLEWTAEANPESLSPEVADAWRRAGVNRLSLGVQTFHEPALRWMGRMHGAEGAERAVTTARDAGFENLSVDLIFGLPGHLGRSWRDDLERVVTLGPPHVSLYGLTVEDGTPLGRAVAEGRESAADEERYREAYLLAVELLGAAGYEHYEVSNFARPGAASRHNGAYWDGSPYLGLGNGAHSYRHPVRRWNVRGWPEYAARLQRGESAEAGREELDAAATRLERLWLALRTDAGLATYALSPAGERVVGRWLDEGLATEVDGRVRLTALGWLELDGLALELDATMATERSSAGRGRSERVPPGTTETVGRGGPVGPANPLDPPSGAFRSSIHE